MREIDAVGADERVIEVRVALQRLGSELRLIAEANQATQQALTMALTPLIHRDAGNARTIQGLDMMFQLLMGLSQFAEQLADNCRCGCIIDARAACAELTISDLAKRLCLREHDDYSPAEARSGDYEHFD